MSQLTIVAHIHAKPEHIALVQAELEKLIPITRAEAGCLQYDLHRDNADPAHFMFGGFKYEVQHGLTRRETPRGVS